MTKKVTEAETAAAIANAFGRKPAARAVEAQQAGKPVMSVNEALDVQCSAAFRSVDPARLAEAQAVLTSARPGTSGRADLQGRMTALMKEVTSLSESRLGLSAERAALNAQSEALRCRESSSSVAHAVEVFEMYRDALISRPMHSLRGLRGSTSASESGRQRLSGSTTKVVRS